MNIHIMELYFVTAYPTFSSVVREKFIITSTNHESQRLGTCEYKKEQLHLLPNDSVENSVCFFNACLLITMLHLLYSISKRNERDGYLSGPQIVGRKETGMLYI